MTTRVDTALALLASLVLEDGRRWGEAAEPVQWRDAASVLDVDGPRRHWLGRSRGYSKTTDTAGLTLAMMLTQLAPGAAAYAGAADKDQARLLADKIRGFVQRTPELAGALTVQSYRVVAERNGVVLEVLAADAASAYGLTPALLVIDELCQWPGSPNAREFFTALTTALPKVPDARLVVMSTAGDPAGWPRKVYDQALKSSLWRVSEVHGPAPWQSAAEIAEQEAALMPSMFRRLFHNEWTASEDKLVDPSDLDAAMVLNTPQSPDPDRQYVAGLDVGLKNDRTVLVVGHAERVPDGDGHLSVRVDIDHLVRWRGSREHPVQLEDIEAAVLEVWRRYRPRILVDPWQAAGLVQRLAGRGVRISEFPFTTQSVGRVAHGLYSLLRSRRIRLPRLDDTLREELLNVRLRESAPGVFRLDHDSGRHDDQAVAIGLVAQDLAAGPPDSAASFLRALSGVGPATGSVDPGGPQHGIDFWRMGDGLPPGDRFGR